MWSKLGILALHRPTPLTLGFALPGGLVIIGLVNKRVLFLTHTISTFFTVINVFHVVKNASSKWFIKATT